MHSEKMGTCKDCAQSPATWDAAIYSSMSRKVPLWPSVYNRSWSTNEISLDLLRGMSSRVNRKLSDNDTLRLRRYFDVTRALVTLIRTLWIFVSCISRPRRGEKSGGEGKAGREEGEARTE